MIKSVQLFQEAQSDTVQISLRDTVKFKYYTSLPSPESVSQQDVSLLWWQILSAIVTLSGTLWPDTHEITRNRPQVLFRKGLYRSKSEQAPKMPLQPPGFTTSRLLCYSYYKTFCSTLSCFKIFTVGPLKLANKDDCFWIVSLWCFCEVRGVRQAESG